MNFKLKSKKNVTKIDKVSYSCFMQIVESLQGAPLWVYVAPCIALMWVCSFVQSQNLVCSKNCVL